MVFKSQIIFLSQEFWLYLYQKKLDKMSNETYYKALENETKIEILQDEIKELKDKIEKLEDVVNPKNIFTQEYALSLDTLSVHCYFPH